MFYFSMCVWIQKACDTPCFTYLEMKSKTEEVPKVIQHVTSLVLTSLSTTDEWFCFPKSCLICSGDLHGSFGFYLYPFPWQNHNFFSLYAGCNFCLVSPHFPAEETQVSDAFSSNATHVEVGISWQFKENWEFPWLVKGIGLTLTWKTLV